LHYGYAFCNAHPNVGPDALPCCLQGSSAACLLVFQQWCG
jgi:hypothetical protein